MYVFIIWYVHVCIYTRINTVNTSTIEKPVYEVFLLRCLCVSDRMAGEDLFIEHPPAHIMEVRTHNIFSSSSLNKLQKEILTSTGLSFSF